MSWAQRRPLIRKLLYKRDGGACFYCQKPTKIYKLKRQMTGNPPDDCATIEHLLNKSQGGSNEQENLVIACFPCNQERGTKNISWQEFKQRKGQ